MKKMLAIMSLSLMSMFAQSQEVVNKEPVYEQKDVNSVKELKKDTWNYFSLNEGKVDGKFAARLQDSKNENDVALVFIKVKDKEMGIIEYPMIGMTSDKPICNKCKIDVTFDKETETFIIEKADKDTYKINKTSRFAKLFSENKQAKIKIPNFGTYEYKYDDLNFPISTNNWMKFDGIEKTLNVNFKMSVLESLNSGGAITISHADKTSIISVLIEDGKKCKKYECKLDVTFDKTKKTYETFQLHSEFMISESDYKNFIELLNKSNTVKVSLNGVKGAKTYTFDNTVKDYQ